MDLDSCFDGSGSRDPMVPAPINLMDPDSGIRWLRIQGIDGYGSRDPMAPAPINPMEPDPGIQ